MKRICVVLLILVGFFVFADNARVVERVVDESVRVERVSVEASRTDPELFAVPLRLNYQGFLTDDNGNAIDDTATMVFKIFTASVGGSELWSSGNQLLDVVDGVFHFILASVPLSVFEAGDARWLELAVRGQVLSPRTEITSVAWSYASTLADSADGSARIGGQTLSALDSRYINDGENAGGDLSWAYPDPTVAKIQNHPVSSTAPSTGQVLKWDGGQWVPANDTAGGADNDWIITDTNMYAGVSGNVGIGTSEPQAKLEVNGVICGGASHTVWSPYGAILGGQYNTVGHPGANDAAVVCGGKSNMAGSSYGAVLGGYNNTAGQGVLDSASVVCGGHHNTSGLYSAICGGQYNNAFEYGTVGGGTSNNAGGKHATVAGGYSNVAMGSYSAVGGGNSNWSDSCGTVGGGAGNHAGGAFGTVGGGSGNMASFIGVTIGGGLGNNGIGYAATVAGGRDNNAVGSYSCVGGGYVNAAADSHSTVGGGHFNQAEGKYATIGGGFGNHTYGAYNTVAGGETNHAELGHHAYIGGGNMNNATAAYATVGGGQDNWADNYATVSGGWSNAAGLGICATVAGGRDNNAVGSYSCVGGGYVNAAADSHSTVGGGGGNQAEGNCATIGGGFANHTYGASSTIAGGEANIAEGNHAAVGGGIQNAAIGNFATVAGGGYSLSGAAYSFAAGFSSMVLSGYDNSAAFNGQTATASSQTRVGTLSKASGTFTIDHPLDPMNKILNHYFVESPEMVLIYRGIAVIGAVGRAEVQLPDYYDALNKNSQIQLTGIGTYEVFVAEKVRNNRFVIGGRPGTEVHWVVTGERKDPSAEITKIIMPVEQAKDGDLAGRSLDDDFLCSTRGQLERMGRAADFKFRLASSQQRYEEMKRMITEKR